jgi:hypothetical protein
MSATASPIPFLPRYGKELRRLTQVSHKMPMDLLESVPWQLGIDETAAPKIEASSWIYGTPYWDRLDADQRRELLWQETARDVSMFIWLEQTLPPLYMGYVNTHGSAIEPSVRDYLMIFSKEEIVHTLSFRTYMELAGLELFKPSTPLQELFQSQLAKLPPVVGVLATLLIEMLAELTAMHATDADGVDPLTRALFHRHHVDELRHIAFGRWVAQSYFATASADEAARTRAFCSGLVRSAVPYLTFNPEIVERLGFPIFGADEPETAIQTVRTSPHATQLNQQRYGEVFALMTSLGIPS